MPESKNRMLSLLVANEPGVLGRICAVFSKRGINIASLVVSDEKVSGLADVRFDSRSSTPGSAAVSRICIGVEPSSDKAHPLQFEHLVEGLLKQVDVLDCKLADTESEPISVELMLVKLRLGPSDDFPKISQVIQHFEGKTIHYDADCLVCMITGREAKLNAAFSVLDKGYEILESIRTGAIVMSRGIERTSGEAFCQASWKKKL
jgi:acetolactate synthase I/III small subunit